MWLMLNYRHTLGEKTYGTSLTCAHDLVKDLTLGACCDSPSAPDLLLMVAWGVGGDTTTSRSFYAAALFGSVVEAVQMRPSSECSESANEASGDPSDDFMLLY